MADDGDGLAAWMYGECEVKARVAGRAEVTIREEIGYAFDTNVVMAVTSDRSAAFPPYLRVPAQAEEVALRMCGEEYAVERGFAICVERLWSNGDRLEISFMVSVRHKSWDNENGSVTVSYGPLSYLVKIGEHWEA